MLFTVHDAGAAPVGAVVVSASPSSVTAAQKLLVGQESPPASKPVFHGGPLSIAVAADHVADTFVARAAPGRRIRIRPSNVTKRQLTLCQSATTAKP
jgi:hypothetical protein